MNKYTALGVIAAFLVIIGVSAFTLKPSTNTSVSNADDAAVRAFVVDFGNKFKNVSLLAPDAADQIAREYAIYVSPELLGLWQAQPNTAPGRQTSSPWPDRIEVVSVTPRASGDAFQTYQVEGSVIEVANADTPLEPVAVYPVSLTVHKQGSAWVITTMSRGAYSELSKRETIIGYWECLPHKDTTGPQTEECALGIAVEASDGHYAVDTRLMSTYPVDFATGTKVRVQGIVTPVQMLSSEQKYDIDGIISATVIERVVE